MRAVFPLDKLFYLDKSNEKFLINNHNLKLFYLLNVSQAFTVYDVQPEFKLKLLA
jgi:hypothetical protein